MQCDYDDSTTDNDSDEDAKPSPSDHHPPKKRITLTFLRSSDFRYDTLVKRTISDLKTTITLHQPMLVCDELEEVIASSIQKVAKEMGLDEIPSEINGQVRNAVWDYL